jgi:hypothetical protein
LDNDYVNNGTVPCLTNPGKVYIQYFCL